jgi:hypothetical protein
MSTKPKANKVTPANAGSGPQLRFRGSRHWPGVAEFGRWARFK